MLALRDELTDFPSSDWPTWALSSTTVRAKVCVWRESCDVAETGTTPALRAIRGRLCGLPFINLAPTTTLRQCIRNHHTRHADPVRRIMELEESVAALHVNIKEQQAKYERQIKETQTQFDLRVKEDQAKFETESERSKARALDAPDAEKYRLIKAKIDELAGPPGCDIFHRNGPRVPDAHKYRTVIAQQNMPEATRRQTVNVTAANIRDARSLLFEGVIDPDTIDRAATVASASCRTYQQCLFVFFSSFL